VIHHHHFERLNSTNTYAKTLAQHISHHPESALTSQEVNAIYTPTIITTDAQTHGRGQGDHTWHSPPKAGLYYTLLVPLGHIPLISDEITRRTFPMRIGKIVVSCIHEITNTRPYLEWPNDILIHHKKLGGILIESLSNASSPIPRYLIIGIGINLNHTEFPFPITSTAISIYQVTSTYYDPSLFTIPLTKRILSECFSFSTQFTINQINQ
jgi:BirA family biotin operon repressor/biotin-[acetyl-CoA-carboxylase] ligase